MPDLHSSSRTAVPPANRQVWSLPLQAKVHPLLWIPLALAIMVLDFFTGPFVQVAILFVFPVALATWSQGWVWGAIMAAALPLMRLPFFYLAWHVPSSWVLEVADTAIDILVLLSMVWMIDHIARQRREIHVLEGMLPICGFCKRIRDESGGWLQMEGYIAQRSEAKFTHTFCPDCGRKHYGDLIS